MTITGSLPDFVVAGARKAGSTWLDECLRVHPEVSLPSETKELFYFDRYYQRGAEWYASCFSRLKSSLVVGEISPSYMAHPGAPARLAYALPAAKVIFIIRDPIARSLSDFAHHWSKGDVRAGSTFTDACAVFPSIISESRYSEHLARWFYEIPRNRLCVIVLEDAASDPQLFISKLYRIVGVDPAFNAPVLHHSINSARSPRSHLLAKAAFSISRSLARQQLHSVVNRAKKLGVDRLVMTRASPPNASGLSLHPTDRARLEDALRPDVERLSGLLCRDMSATWTWV